MTAVDGDVFDLERRTTVNGEGAVVEERGHTTTDFLGPDGQLLIDEVDTSGKAVFTFKSDGSLRVVGSGGFWFTTPEEESAVDAAGLPRTFIPYDTVLKAKYAPGGVDLLKIRTDGPVTDLCSLLPAPPT